MSDYFASTPIADLWLYKPPVFKDQRGHFFESYNAAHFERQGLSRPFVQDNRSSSQKGTLRGLHMQVGDSAQAKLVSVLVGHVFDVAVDLRPGSPTFKKWYGVHLKAEEPLSLYIPRGFAHGFLVLSEHAEFFYKVDQFYDRSSERGIHCQDPDLAISWPLPESQWILSDKDKNLGSFKAWAQEFK